MEYINYNIRKFFFPLAVICFVVLLMSGCKKKETYTVTFDANGGIGTMQPQTFVEDEPQALRLNEFTCDNCTFSYWSPLKQHVFSTPESPKNEYRNGETITVSANMILYAHWTSNGTNPAPTPQRHEYVDLGLPSGTKWATCNVGAETIEGYGNYYAWGETEPKEIYDWNNYRWCNGLENSLIKYCNSSDFSNNGFVDTLTVLELDDDVATVNWGTNWRMPTQYEMIELFSECSHEWITLNGINGRKFTGPNGNSIFLPAAGLRKDNDMSYVGSEVYYWTSTLPPYYTNQNSAWALYFKNNTCDLTGPYRYYGIVVRPVLIENN